MSHYKKLKNSDLWKIYKNKTSKYKLNKKINYPSKKNKYITELIKVDNYIVRRNKNLKGNIDRLNEDIIRNKNRKKLKITPRNIDEIERILKNIKMIKSKDNFLNLRIKYTNNFNNNININYIINHKSIREILKSLKDEGGDEEYEYIIKELRKANELIFELITKDEHIRRTKQKINIRNQGNFFDYYNKTDIELKRYGIFKEYNSEMEMNCFIYAMKQLGYKKDVLLKIYPYCVNDTISICKLKDIARELKIYIELLIIREDNTKNKTRLIKYGNKEHTKISIGLLNNHYFINEKTIYSKYSIINYNKIKNIDNWNDIYIKTNNKYKKSKERKINSFKLISLLLENKNKYLNIISTNDLLKLDNSNIEYNLNVDEDLLEYQLYKYDSKYDNEKELTSIYTLDTEATTQGIHTCYCISIYSSRENKIIVSEYGLNCVSIGLNKFFDYLDKKEYFKPIIYIHNLKYDFTHLKNYIKINKIIINNNKILNIDCYLIKNNKKIKIILRDSYSMISKPLKKFADMFQLDVNKEAYPYNIYTLENINKNSLPIQLALNDLKSKEEKQIFLSNIKNLRFIGRNSDHTDGRQFGGGAKMHHQNFNHKLYCKYYCDRDVEVLCKGLIKFNTMINKITKLDICNFITAPSLSNKYFLKSKVYDGCCIMKNIVRLFIQKSVVGGRTMSAFNKMYNLDEKISDFDAVSLYPSAMKRLADELGGFLLGKPIKFNNSHPIKAGSPTFNNKVVSDTILNYNSELEIKKTGSNESLLLNNTPTEIVGVITYNFLSKQSGYFVEIDIINDYRKKRAFPVISIIRDNKRQWINDIKGRIIVDKITLEDFIKFHEMKPGIDFKIIQGYYFNNSRSCVVGKVIEKLFNSRLKYKKENNPIQEVLKLLMNSVYGKTIQKPIDSNYKFIYSKKEINAKEELFNYIFRHKSYIKEWIEITKNECYLLKEGKTTEKFKNFNQIGSEILSMSKRIMNEVMYLAEDNGINIWYQDTDSIHIKTKDINRLSELYKDIYKRELIGKELGMFHSDFNNYIEEIKTKADKVNSIKTIILGKKAYYDRLELIKDDKVYYKHHIRLKGIPEKIILYKCKKLNISIEELFNKLYNHKEISFNLAIDNHINCSFEFTKNYNVFTREKFIRKIKF